VLTPRRVFSEGTETPIGIDVIDHYSATWSKMRPGSIQFEAYVAFAMQAVMHEQTKMTELGKYLGEAQSAWAFDVGPARCEAVIDRYADLLSPIPFQWWQVDTPEMAFAISFQRLQNEA
jgi:hypothetical protein